MKIKVPRLIDPHCHFREDFGVIRALIRLAIEGGVSTCGLMPNTKEGLKTADEVNSYLVRVASCLTPGQLISFFAFLLINEETGEEQVTECVGRGIKSSKIYPFDRTTNSDNHGVRRYGRLIPTVKHCGKVGMKVHLHPEHPWMTFDNRDAEFAFLPIADMFLQETDAIIVWEHGTDARCIPFWKEMAESGRFFVTLTCSSSGDR